MGRETNLREGAFPLPAWHLRLMSSLVLRPLDPARFRPPPPTSDGRRIAILILEGKVEVQGRSGFVSGPTAYAELVQKGPGKDPGGYTAGLSLRALDFAQALGRRDAKVLARRLYGFNSLPSSPRRIRRVGSSPRLRHLFDPDLRGVLHSEGWIEGGGGTGSRGWTLWRRDSVTPRDSLRGPTFKLYVSPKPEWLPDAVAAAVPILSESVAWAFKVASSPGNTLRPDKMVVYFSTMEALERTGRELSSALSDLPAQGVPFSVGLSDDGLLSWGIDPAWSGPGTAGVGPTSWRGWITRYLAEAMAEATNTSGGPEPKDYALTRLALQGFDDETFAPPTGWRGSAPPWETAC